MRTKNGVEWRERGFLLFGHDDERTKEGRRNEGRERKEGRKEREEKRRRE